MDTRISAKVMPWCWCARGQNIGSDWEGGGMVELAIREIWSGKVLVEWGQGDN